MFSSLRQLSQICLTFSFCSKRADLRIRCSKSQERKKDREKKRIPSIQTISKRQHMAEGTGRLMETEKSGSSLTKKADGVRPDVCPAGRKAAEETAAFWGSQDQSHAKSSRFRGRKGRKNRKKRGNHKRYWVRLDKRFLPRYLIPDRRPMHRQRNRLQIKKWITKGSRLIPSFLPVVTEKAAEGFQLRRGECFLLQVRTYHGSQITAIIAVQKGTALLPEVFLFLNQRSINKNPALLFIGKGFF